MTTCWLLPEHETASRQTLSFSTQPVSLHSLPPSTHLALQRLSKETNFPTVRREHDIVPRGWKSNSDTNVGLHTHTNTQEDTQRHTHTHVHTNTLEHTRRHTHTHVHTNTRADIHTRTYTQIHTHIAMSRF